ncbi:MAG: SDR family NAD(P)-dependent oxidoreductase [Proteobacteria bacterium]|nr:SDR family NAD(P)-dependent oxidoreductase [Pseudomonadota bacterium]
MSDFAGRISHLSPVKLAFAAQQFEAQLALMRAEPIAIIGMACRFPGGANDPDSFWRLLKSGTDAIGEIPGDRWDVDAYYDPDPEAPGKMYCRRGGYLDQVDLFDAAFFGISPREAISMDPQQRLLLEVSWEALECANQPSLGLFGSDTGVFVGISTFDYAAQRIGLADRASIDAYYTSGTTLSVAAGRLSYLLGLTGPCMSIDTACSSSLVALHLACQSLRNRECSMALAGGVGLILTPEPAISFSKARMLAPDGRCKTFDATADGYGRGEGCGVVVLKRLADAIADGDNILALVRGSAVNQDGPSGGLTVPNGPSQEEVIRRALAGGGLAPQQVSYVEAHGTGTSLGDPIEVNALAASLCKKRSVDNPLIIGSVKTNIGHLEAAAGIAGVIKVILSLQHQEIPGHLHFNKPNPHIDWPNMPIEVAAQGRAWLPPEGRRIAGVSGFGFSGTNAHVILEEAPVEEEREKSAVGQMPHILALSAKNAEALNFLVARYARQMAQNPGQEIGDFCYTANTCRSHFGCRLAIVAATREELLAGFAAVPQAKSDRAAVGLWRSKSKVAAGSEAPMVRCEIPTDRQAVRSFLAGIAEQYVNGAAIAWDTLYEGTSWQKVTLPTYPFQGERFWLETGGTAESSIISSLPAAKLPGRRLQLPLSGEIRFEMPLRRNSPAFLADHHLFGTVVVAGATYISLLVQAAHEGFGAGPVVLEEVLLAQVLTIGEQDALLLQTIISPEVEGRGTFHVMSGTGKEGGEWKSHVSGQIRITDGTSSIPDRLPLKEMSRLRDEVEKDWEVLAGSELYAEIAEAGHHLGSSFKWIQEIRRRGKEAFCLLARPVSPRPYNDFQIYPGLIDSCFQFFCIWGQRLLSSAATEELADQNFIFIPFSLGRVEFSGNPVPAGRLWCHSVVREYDQLGKGMTGDIVLFAEDSSVILKISGFTARKISRDLVRKGVTENQDKGLCQVEWRPLKIEKDSAKGVAEGRWLIFADDHGLGETMAADLQRKGDSAIMVGAGSEYDRISEGHYRINPRQPDDFRRLFRASCEDVHPIKGIVFMWALETGEETSLDSLAKVEVLGCGAVLYLLQALAAADKVGRPRLWLVTRGGQTVNSKELRICAQQAMLWGLANVIRLEHPELKCTCLDLDPRPDEDSAKLLAELLLAADREERIAIRQGLFYAARLVAQPLAHKGDFSVSENGTYLITGGLGALGVETARWLARKGARHPALVGRGAGSASAQEQIAALRDSGVKVRVFAIDLGRRPEVKRMLREIAAEMPALRGIVHAAGVLADGVLLQQGFPQLRQVMAPKVDGAWHLHEETRELPLDFFVCYSSIASVLGSAGQANYAAANAFLDSLVHERRRQGLHGLSINWGAWDKGMAAGLDRRGQERVKAMGLTAITTEQGFKVLGQLLQEDLTSSCVLPVNWPTYLAYHYRGSVPGFFEAMATKEKPPEQKAEILAKLAASSTGESPAVLFDYVRTQVAATLRMKSAQLVPGDLGLFDLGVDSLMAVELKNRFEADLGRTLRPTLVFDYPTVEAITGYLAQELGMVFGAVDEFREDFPGQLISKPAVSLSPDEVDDEILAELAKLESLLKGK